MPRKHRVLRFPLFKSNHSKILKDLSRVRAGLSQERPSAFRVANAFTSGIPPVMNSPPCSRIELSSVLADLNARPLPSWYDAAKFGIFIHWGLWAIPAFAARLGSITDAVKADYDRAMAMIPYTEWYANAIKVAGTPSAQFHQQTYGDAPYEAFREPFLDGLKAWDPTAWAEVFRDAG